MACECAADAARFLEAMALVLAAIANVEAWRGRGIGLMAEFVKRAGGSRCGKFYRAMTPPEVWSESAEA